MTSYTIEYEEIADAYNEVAARELEIDGLRDRMDQLATTNDEDTKFVYPRCLACGSTIEDKEAVGMAYCLKSQIFTEESRNYLVCVWCKETILWNEIRTQFLKDVQLDNFDLFNDDMNDDNIDL